MVRDQNDVPSIEELMELASAVYGNFSVVNGLKAGTLALVFLMCV